jgi:hypothetical protein
MLLSTTFLAKPMFRVNKPSLIPKQTMHVMWQNISWLVKKKLCHVMEYFAMSLSNFHVANEYTKNIPWHGMEYF